MVELPELTYVKVRHREPVAHEKDISRMEDVIFTLTEYPDVILSYIDARIEHISES